MSESTAWFIFDDTILMSCYFHTNEDIDKGSFCPLVYIGQFCLIHDGCRDITIPLKMSQLFE